MPIRDREDAAEVQAQIDRIFVAAPQERAAAIRTLFVEVLDFNTEQGQADLADPRGGVELPENAERIAELEGMRVLHVALNAPENGRVRNAEVSEAARLIADQLGDDLLLVVTSVGASQLHLVLPELSGSRPTLRRMVVERDLPQRTAVQQISNIYWENQDTGSIRSALDNAFDVEPVTKRFFTEYKRVFDRVEQNVTGFAAGEDEERRLFVQTLFNRLMFSLLSAAQGLARLPRRQGLPQGAVERLPAEPPRDGQLPPQPAQDPVLRRPQQPGLARPDWRNGAADRHGPLPQRWPIRAARLRRARAHRGVRRGH